jgi:hypothetical protein
MRDHWSVQPRNSTRPLTATDRLDTEFDAAGEQNLHSDAHSEHRSTGGYPLGNKSVAADGPQTRHARFVCPDARYHQAVRRQRSTRIGCDFYLGAYPFQGPLRRTQIAGPVIEYDQPLMACRHSASST